MLQGIFSIYDSKAGCYSRPFFAPTDEVAIRMFQSACKGEGDLKEYPEDYTLFKLGEFSDEDGELLPVDTPRSVVGAWEVFKMLQDREPGDPNHTTQEWAGKVQDDIKEALMRGMTETQ